jgi:DNA-binding transcriptional LysR family regulator
MDIARLDLNLLVVFDALVRHGSVTAAGQELGLSQPAVSYALVKMRKTFEDPLFVRVSTGMRPTPRALAMIDPVRDVLQCIRTDVLSHSAFDPGRSAREFRIATSDVGESFFVPPIARALQMHGAQLRLKVLSPTPAVLEQQLEAGDIDLAVGHYPDLRGADFFQQALFTSRFVCIARPGNPHLKGKLTMSRFLRAPHVDVSTPGRSQEIILGFIAEKKLVRNVPLQVSRFLSLLEIVSQSDMLAVVPLEVGESFQQGGRVAVRPLPFESPTFRLRQHWHKRYHDDSANRWLRELVHRLFTEDAAARAS